MGFKLERGEKGTKIKNLSLGQLKGITRQYERLANKSKKNIENETYSYFLYRCFKKFVFNVKNQLYKRLCFIIKINIFAIKLKYLVKVCYNKYLTKEF